ncbi:transposase [Microbacterium sp. A1-JK]|uniref:transposase n=1 Tax=Microbacterium sp. A1-JK TaxID=3177516 RepID=UPI0038895796
MVAETPYLHVVESREDQVKTSRPPYGDAFRLAAVMRVRGGQPVAQVARDLGLARNTLKSWMGTVDSSASRSPQTGIAAAATSGSRLAVLVALRDEIASQIENGIAARDLPANARLLKETLLEIDEARTRESEMGVLAGVDDEPFDAGAI